MGTLKPGATYIYERHDGIVYAREFGAPHEDRFVVGYESGKDYDPYNQRQDRWSRWQDVLRAADSNKELADLLDRALVLYNLSKKDER
jgi:hypothetical protein